MKRPSRSNKLPPSPRRGHTLIMAVIVLTLSTAILTTAVRSTLTRYKSAARFEVRTQADCLAESALGIAISRCKTNPDYPGGEWTVDVPGHGQAHVLLTVTRSTPDRHRALAAVLLPRDAPVTAQVRVERNHTWAAPMPSASE